MVLSVLMSRGFGWVQTAALVYIYEMRVAFTRDFARELFGPSPAPSDISSLCVVRCAACALRGWWPVAVASNCCGSCQGACRRALDGRRAVRVWTCNTASTRSSNAAISRHAFATARAAFGAEKNSSRSAHGRASIAEVYGAIWGANQRIEIIRRSRRAPSNARNHARTQPGCCAA